LAKSFFGKLPIHGSMYQSVKRGQRTEIDYLNGEILSLGKKKGVPTPANSLIVGLIHEVEATGEFLTVPELTRRLNRRLRSAAGDGTPDRP
jgi:2-dehydropantoate 2-reductase